MRIVHVQVYFVYIPYIGVYTRTHVYIEHYYLGRWIGATQLLLHGAGIVDVHVLPKLHQSLDGLGQFRRYPF